MTPSLVAAAARPEDLLDDERGLAWLTPGELRQWAALASPLRSEYLAAHLLVRVCAATLMGISPQTVSVHQSCAECGAEGHGRPLTAEQPDVYLSLAHTDGMVAAAASLHQHCGIDVEPERLLSTRVAERFLTPSEMASARHEGTSPMTYWRRKEALAKAGFGTLTGLFRIDTSHVRNAVLRVRDGVHQQRFRLWEITMTGLAVCLVSADLKAKCTWLEAEQARAALRYPSRTSCQDPTRA